MNTMLYQNRRAQVAAQIGPRGLAIVPTAPEQRRNRDADFPYRFDSYFHYLCGFAEPGAWLVITGTGKSILFCQPKDLERETWDGYRLGPQAASAFLGVDEAYALSELEARLPGLLDGCDNAWYPFATHSGLEARVQTALQNLRERVRYGTLCPGGQQDLCSVLDEMRLIKDAQEQDTMRRAGQISAGAHIRAMQTSARMLRAGQEVRAAMAHSRRPIPLSWLPGPMPVSCTTGPIPHW